MCYYLSIEKSNLVELSHIHRESYLGGSLAIHYVLWLHYSYTQLLMLFNVSWNYFTSEAAKDILIYTIYYILYILYILIYYRTHYIFDVSKLSFFSFAYFTGCLLLRWILALLNFCSSLRCCCVTEYLTQMAFSISLKSEFILASAIWSADNPDVQGYCFLHNYVIFSMVHLEERIWGNTLCKG